MMVFVFDVLFLFLKKRVVQSLSRVQLFGTPWTAARQASPSFTVSWGLLKLMSIESVMPSNYLILCHPFLFLPSTFPSTRVFSSESAALCIRWTKNWSFSSSPSNEYWGLISFRIDWFDLLAVLLWLSNTPLYIYHNFFIHPSVDGNLGCFHILTIVNSAAMNIGVQVSFSIIIFSGYMPNSGIAGSYGSFIPSF